VLLQCLFEDGTGVGITSVKIIGNRVVAAKLSGSVDFLELESYSHGRQMDWGFTAYRRSELTKIVLGTVLGVSLCYTWELEWYAHC